MFARHTERARRVLLFARYEAGRAGSPAVEPEHLLLALIREGTGLSALIFERARVSPDEVRRTIESRTTRRAATSSGEDLPLSASTNQVLEFAAQESDRLLHNYVGTEHLLLGVFREQRSLAASILAERGLQINQVRDEIASLIGDRQARRVAGPSTRGQAGRFRRTAGARAGQQTDDRRRWNSDE